MVSTNRMYLQNPKEITQFEGYCVVRVFVSYFSNGIADIQKIHLIA